MPRALVTGISGQTGGYLAEVLISTGWEVHGLVRPDDESTLVTRALLPDAQLHVGDVSDSAGLADLILSSEPDTVYNLAGISSVARSWEAPLETATVTGMPISVVLDAAWRLQERRGSPVRVVQASSAEIFGNPDHSPQNEETPVRPSNPYGAAKAYGHHLVGVYRDRGLPATSCILYNHESPRRPPTFVTRKITMTAARIALGLQDRLSLGNVDARRDWGWAPDYARALQAASDVPDDYVIATGQAHSVQDFVGAAFRAAGVDDWQQHVDIDASLKRPGDAGLQVGDASKARRALGWTPSVTFPEIVTAMVEADLVLASAGGDR